MAGQDFTCSISGVKQTGSGDNQVLVFELSVPHMSIASTLLLAYMAELKRLGERVFVQIETPSEYREIRQLNLWEAFAARSVEPLLEAAGADIVYARDAEFNKRQREKEEERMQSAATAPAYQPPAGQEELPDLEADPEEEQFDELDMLLNEPQDFDPSSDLPSQEEVEVVIAAGSRRRKVAAE